MALDDIASRGEDKGEKKKPKKKSAVHRELGRMGEERTRATFTKDRECAMGGLERSRR